MQTRMNQQDNVATVERDLECPTDLLREEHGFLYGGLKCLKLVTDRIAAGLEDLDPMLSQILDLLETYVRVVHHAHEEMVFDVIRRKDRQEQLEALRELDGEHLEEQFILATLQAEAKILRSASPQKRDAFIGTIAVYVESATAHIMKENTVFFPLLKSWLTEEDRREILEAFSRPSPGTIETDVREFAEKARELLESFDVLR